MFLKIRKYTISLLGKIKKFFDNRKYSISLLDEVWKPLDIKIKLRYLPRKDELIFIESLGKYFEIVNLIHYLNKKQGIFVIIREFKINSEKT